MNTARSRAEAYIRRLATEIGERHPGSAANREATEFAAEVLSEAGWTVETPEFPVLDWTADGASLTVAGRSFEILPGPYSPAFEGEAPVVVASGKSQLSALSAGGARQCILVLRGDAAAEQLFPWNFPFYQSPEHREVYELIRAARPAAVVAATSRNPEAAGAVYPFPLIEDADFDIPSAYMRDTEGEALAALFRNSTDGDGSGFVMEQAGRQSADASGDRPSSGSAGASALARLSIRSRRIESTARNVIARRLPNGNSGAATTGDANGKRRFVLTAHIDSKYGTPGALDNAAGVVTLLVVAGILRERDPAQPVEIALFNGEDYYAASGQVHYLKTVGVSSDAISLAVNVDAVGLRGHRAAFSVYECPSPLEGRIRTVLSRYPAVVEGPVWYQSDHMVFVQAGVPAVAITSERFAEDIAAAVAHTPADREELVDPAVLVDAAEALAELAVSRLDE